MTLLAAMVAGVGVGLGVVVGFRALFPRPVPLGKALADLGRPRRSLAELDTVSATSGMAGWIGQVMVRVVESTGLVDLGGLRRRLRALGKPIEAHVFEKLLGGIAGLLVPVMFSLMLAAAG